MYWVLVYYTTCGPILWDGPLCWRDTTFVFQTRGQCEDVRNHPPANGEFRCLRREEQR